MSKLAVDKIFLSSVIVLTVVGFFIFSSASLGLLAKGGDKYSDVSISQTVFGLLGGTIGMIILSRFNYRKLKKFSFYIFLLSIIATLLVFVPGLGLSHGGAKRWIIIAGFSFQTSELLKLGFIVYLAAWLSSAKDKVSSFKFGLLPLCVIFGIVGLVLLAQPDTDTYAVLICTGLAMFIVAGGRWKHIFMIVVAALIGLLIITSFRPYLKARIQTFLDPSQNGESSSYQIQQSLIAIGSGGLFGRGFGQSIQKFNFLPEPIGDSIFAVLGEEFGFFGALILILLFVFFAMRGSKIATRSPDLFGRLLTIGIVIMIVSQAFVNIAAMLGLVPLTGITLPFVSHGGTALFFTLCEVGIILNISRFQSKFEKNTNK